jgi:Set1/Ash2 histone methyltransferase complex subunit ASH2
VIAKLSLHPLCLQVHFIYGTFVPSSFQNHIESSKDTGPQVHHPVIPYRLTTFLLNCFCNILVSTTFLILRKVNFVATCGHKSNMETTESRSEEINSVDVGDANATLSTAIPTRKRGKLLVSNPLDAVTCAAFSSAVQHMTNAGYLGLAGLLASVTQDSQQNTSMVPSVEVVRQAAKKAVVEQPVWVHWSKQDMAPHFKCDSTRLSISGAMRGYRMARASHGVASSGSYYFECVVLPGPSATEILHSLPPNARLGPGLREKLQAAVEWEQKQACNQLPLPFDNIDENTSKRRKVDDDQTSPSPVGGHVRIGWSMRTGDLQAPVGYDKWSYAIRDIDGSILHCSRRQDDWGGEGFSEGDVIGCAICFDESSDSDDAANERKRSNHIRFFKNGDCMGQFVISKGKREGGEAFCNIERGTYYPAISCYMGGSVKANFGPFWVCPPKRSRLPPGLKNLKAMSTACLPPVCPDDAVNNVSATVKLFRKLEHQQSLKNAVRAESEIQCQLHSDFLKHHVEEIRQARVERGLSIADLPQTEANTDSID